MGAANFHLKTEENKVKIYEYMKSHRDASVADIGKATGLTRGELMHSLHFLVGRKHLVKMVQRWGTTRIARYNLGKVPYVKRVRKETVREAKQKKKDMANVEPQGVVKVHRLLDNPIAPAPKSKKRNPVYIGSMMSMFDTL